MIIKTITCHDVYNAGASLQAYALQTFLESRGHSVQIIDYKPDYLSRHYSLTHIPNPRYRKPLLAQGYLLAKLPGRLRGRFGKKKRAFDDFRRQYLHLTPRRYESCGDLQANCPEADAFIAGSDQIWNPLLPNGSDPAFFLRFVPEGKKRITYAASFGGDSLSQEDRQRITPWLQQLDQISLRERSGVKLLEELGLKACQVCDPVFLLKKQEWETIAIPPKEQGYLLVYDFDGSEAVARRARELAAGLGCSIWSVFPCGYADRVLSHMGPREFLGAIQNARGVLSNSFHATAFSLIFHREVFVMDRTENLNARMRDLLRDAGLEAHLLTEGSPIPRDPIFWEAVDVTIETWRTQGQQFLDSVLK